MNQFFFQSDSSSEALRRLFQNKKKESSAFSLAFIGKKLGIKSRGYLSDVLSGKKILGEKYLPSISKLFGLDRQQTRYLNFLNARDHLSAKNAATFEVDIKLSRLKKRMLIESDQTIPYHSGQVIKVFKVFCAFSLFKGSPTDSDLKSFFGVSVEKELEILKAWGLIHSEGSHFRQNKEFVIFDQSADGVSHLDFLKAAIKDAMIQIDTQFDDREKCHFESTILSVKRSEFVKKIQKLKEISKNFQSDIETDDADMIVHFNIQAYPAKSKEI